MADAFDVAATVVGVYVASCGAALGVASAVASAFGPPFCTVATTLPTGCSRICRNGLGYSPIQNAIITSGTNVATSRGVRSCSFSFFGFVTVTKNTRWYNQSRYAAARITPGTAHAAHLQFTMNVPSMM